MFRQAQTRDPGSNKGFGRLAGFVGFGLFAMGFVWFWFCFGLFGFWVWFICYGFCLVLVCLVLVCLVLVLVCLVFGFVWLCWFWFCWFWFWFAFGGWVDWFLVPKTHASKSNGFGMVWSWLVCWGGLFDFVCGVFPSAKKMGVQQFDLFVLGRGS